MKLKKALEIVNFSKCDFGPDSDPCDKCGKTNRQMYYRRTDYWENQGEYFCSSCVVKAAEEIESLIEIECECGEVFTGFPHQAGDKCFDCYVCESGMPT